LWQEAQRRSTEVMGVEARSILDGLLSQAEKLAAP
jgi:hypothetical protein